MDAQAPERKWDFDRVFRLLITAAGVIVLLLLVRYLADVLIPFAVALLLAFLLNPIVNTLESRLKRRTPAVLITVFGAGVVVFALLVVLVYVGTQEVSSLRELVQEFVHAPTAEEVKGAGEAIDEFIENQKNPTVRNVMRQVREQLATELKDYVDTLQPAAIAQRVVGFVAGTISFILGLSVLVVILLYLIFLLIDYRLLSDTWRAYLPPQHRTDIIGFLDEFRLAMSRYFRGQFVIASIVGILFAIGFTIIGLRMSILLGLFIGLLNMVPYLQIVGMIPALLLGVVRGLETNSTVLVSVILVLLVFAIVQTIQDTLLTPRIMGRTVGLRPVVLLLSVFIWGKLLGFLGLVLAIPFTCLGIAYYRRFVLGDTAAPVLEGA